MHQVVGDAEGVVGEFLNVNFLNRECQFNVSLGKCVCVGINEIQR